MEENKKKKIIIKSSKKKNDSKKHIVINKSPKKKHLKKDSDTKQSSSLIDIKDNKETKKSIKRKASVTNNINDGDDDKKVKKKKINNQSVSPVKKESDKEKPVKKIKDKKQVIINKKDEKQRQGDNLINNELERENNNKIIDNITNETGLSGFMLDVLTDMYDKGNKYSSSSIIIIDIICRNPDIISLNKEEIDKYKEEYIQKKTSSKRKKEVKNESIVSNNDNNDDNDDDNDKKDDEDEEEEEEEDNKANDHQGVEGGEEEDNKKKKRKANREKQIYTDDTIRKYIIEKEEKKLVNEQILMAGTNNKFTKLKPDERDNALVWKFLGYAQTNTGYFIYLYYVGPTDKGINNIELKNQSNWRIVHKSHLIHFHRRIGNNLNKYLIHSSMDQIETDDGNKNPSYDPRFIVNKWIESKNGKKFKSLIIDNKHIFKHQKDYLIKFFNQQKKNLNNNDDNDIDSQSNNIYYYDESKDVNNNNNSDNQSISPFPLKFNNTQEDEKEKEKTKELTIPFNVEEDRLLQQKNGYQVKDSEFCYINIEEYDSISRHLISKNISFSFEEFKNIAQKAYINNNKPISHKNYEWDPHVLIKAFIIALSQESFIKRTASLVCDNHIQILEKDNIVPIFDYIFNNQTCTNEIKDYILEYIWSILTVHYVTNDLPKNIEDQLLKIINTNKNSFNLL